jgi:hypothetical protein
MLRRQKKGSHQGGLFHQKMINMKNLALKVICGIGVSACNSSKPEQRVYLDNYDLIKDEVINFSVADSITNFIISFEYLDKTEHDIEEDIMVAHDWPSGTLNFFSTKTKTLIKKLKLATDGPNMIGPVLNGFHIKTMDSIFTASSYFISIINSEGIVIYQQNLAKNNDGLSALPQINNGSNIVEYDKKIIMNTAPDISTLQPKSFRGEIAIKVLDLETDKISTKLEYPQIYRKGAFGPNFAAFYQAYNPLTLDIAFSFPADPNLYVAKVDDISNVKTYWGGSKYIESIPSMERKFPDNDDFEYYTRFYVQTPSYGHIFYDKYRQLYYRVAYRPVSDERYIEGVRWKPKSLIIFDNSFNRLGEVDLPEEVNPSAIEPFKDGILINSGGAIEDSLSFTLFKIVDKTTPQKKSH